MVSPSLDCWVGEMDYHGHLLSWIQCIETKTNLETGELEMGHFSHVSNLDLKNHKPELISKAGRLRWKIENEGFNAQKNHGYGLGHKFSRSSFAALKNYYQCLQIAHMINQLAIRSQEIQEILQQTPKLTITHLWKCLLGWMTYVIADQDEFDSIAENRSQIRLK